MPGTSCADKFGEMSRPICGSMCNRQRDESTGISNQGQCGNKGFRAGVPRVRRQDDDLSFPRRFLSQMLYTTYAI